MSVRCFPRAGEAGGDEKAPSAKTEEEDLAGMSQAEKEGKYFKEIAVMQKQKRGGSSSRRKKTKK